MASTVQTIEDNWETRPGPVGPSVPADEDLNLHRALELSQTLQTTLDLHQVLELFSAEVNRAVPHQGIEYRYPEQELVVQTGERACHSCSYELKIEDQSYGEMRFQRNKVFNDDETLCLEYLLCSVLYPLRNALKYREAVSWAQRDALTGTYNRAAMDDTLKRELELSHRHGTELSLIVLDIDKFKSINDQYGHSAGDNVIKSVVEAARDCIRSTDMLFRYGGEEFVVMLRNTSREGARNLAERIRKKTAGTCTMEGSERIRVTVSAGVTSLFTDDTVLSLFERADEALYEAKRGGRNRVELG